MSTTDKLWLVEEEPVYRPHPPARKRYHTTFEGALDTVLEWAKERFDAGHSAEIQCRAKGIEGLLVGGDYEASPRGEGCIEFWTWVAPASLPAVHP